MRHRCFDDVGLTDMDLHCHEKGIQAIVGQKAEDEVRFVCRLLHACPALNRQSIPCLGICKRQASMCNTADGVYMAIAALKHAVLLCTHDQQ